MARMRQPEPIALVRFARLLQRLAALNVAHGFSHRLRNSRI